MLPQNGFETQLHKKIYFSYIWKENNILSFFFWVSSIQNIISVRFLIFL